MRKLTNLFKNLRLRQILTIFVAGVALLVSTACSPANVQGARPNNPPVQAGGANNPAKGGGDGYTQYKMSTDPSVNSNTAGQNRADAQLVSPQLIAANNEELLYPSSEDTNTKIPEIGSASQKGYQSQVEPGTNRDVPNAERLKKVGTAFKEASEFLKDTGKEAGDRPEMKVNPAVQ